MPSIVNERIKTEVEKELAGNAYAFVSTFDKFPMEELSELRRSLEKVANRSIVVKHSILKKLFEEKQYGDLTKQLKGQGHVMVTVGDKDPQNISKAIVDYAKKNEKFVPKVVVFENKLYDETFVKGLATLPSRKELLTQVVVRMKSPISGFVMTLNQLLQGLVVALNEVKKQKESQGAGN
ncbi:MAG: 50S ribosomal protein L10 [Candidatus Omnitrophica bacterium]|nr:50S ribosomal protein L10 [Candidatus Omnitrophota bacterium]